MSIITCTAKTRNDLTVARIVIEVLAQSLNYRLSVTYNDGKSFDVMVPDGQEDNAIAKFKRQAPDLDIYKSSKSTMAKSQKESRIKLEYTIDDEDAYDSGYDAGKDDKKDDDIEDKDKLKASGKSDEYIAGYMDAVKEFNMKSKKFKKESEDEDISYSDGVDAAEDDLDNDFVQSEYDLRSKGYDESYIKGYMDTIKKAGM